MLSLLGEAPKGPSQTVFFCIVSREQPMSLDNLAVRPGTAPSELALSLEPRETQHGRAGPELPLLASPPLAGAREADAVSRSGIVLALHGNLDEIGAQWKAFERHCDRTVFASFEWLAAWQR
ncbi:MAG: hypothetical protein E6G96_14930, partial [Alphaproteobacteria bacterium]